MSNKPADIELAREDEAGNFLLQQKVRGIAADQILLVHADGRQIESGLHAAASMGEEEDLPAATNEPLRFPGHVVRRHGDDGSIEASGMGESEGQLGERSGPRTCTDAFHYIPLNLVLGL